MKRTTLVTISMVVVLTGVLIFFLVISMDSLMKIAVEKYGSAALQTEVTLKKANISLKSGKGTLQGLRVSNPKGFATETAFQFEEVSMTIEARTITKGTVIIKEIIISAPQITYELGPKGSNLDALQRNANRKASGVVGTGGDTQPVNGAQDKGKKLIIESLIIRDGKVNISAVGLQGKKMTVDLPAIRMSNIGKSEGGATPSEVVKQLIEAFNKSTGSAVKNLGLGKVLDEAEGVVKGVKEALEKGETEQIQKKAKEIGDTVKGLFGN